MKQEEGRIGVAKNLDYKWNQNIKKVDKQYNKQMMKQIDAILKKQKQMLKC